MNDFKKDYYKILNITPSATTDEIKLAYRKQAKKYHPDLYPGQPEYENIIKEIIEAYEVLRDKDERYAYDQYLSDKKSKQKEEEESNNPINKNKRTYTKTTTVETEERSYVKGIIFIKYFGKHDEREGENILREIFYKIKVTQVNATIEKKNIFERVLPKEFESVFEKHKPVSLNINQPISCTITYANKNPVDYKLEILDLTIPVTEIINVTKHEGESFGTITGTFYGYVKQVKLHDEKIIVEECFGETGSAEKKNEHGVNYHRQEYYNTDCTKYWGNWVKDSEPVTPPPPSDGRKKPQHKQVSGCAGFFGNIIGIGLSFLLFLFILPQLAFLLPFLVIPFFLNLFPTIWNWVARIIFILFGLVFFLSTIAVIVSHFHNNNQRVVVKPEPTIVKPKYTPVLDTLSNNTIIDTLITHHMIWDDYYGKTYEGDYSIKKSAFNQAHFYKENLDISANSENNYDKIIFSLKENDKKNLDDLYIMFDSLKMVNKPSSMAFAEIVVSFVQSIPYTLVLPKACDAQFYQDEFTATYLARPDARCDGYERYGINTPVEFMANLNGDCDTRTLMLYTILSHYNYDVALLSSAHYSHSILGINLPYEGSAYNYNNQRYVLWETTIQNVKPGILSNEISNTDYWRISLKSK